MSNQYKELTLSIGDNNSNLMLFSKTGVFYTVDDNKLLYSLKDMKNVFGITSEDLYRYFRGLPNSRTNNKVIKRVEKTNQNIEQYANQFEKTSIKYCDVCGVSNKGKRVLYNDQLDKYLCAKHLRQFKTYGLFLDNSSVCVFDPNHYEIIGNYVLVDCYDQHGVISRKFLCDIDDLELVKQYRWRVTDKRGTYYVVTGNQYSEIKYFHLEVMGKYIDGEIDHINRDTLDNRKCNLRAASYSDQKINQKISSRNKSGFKGVSYSVQQNNYVVDFSYNRKRLYIKRFDNLNEAVYARYVLEVGIYPEYRDSYNDPNIFKLINELTNHEKENIKLHLREKIRVQSYPAPYFDERIKDL